MIRESLTSGSRYAFMGISPDGTFRWQRRSWTGGWTWSTTSTIGTLPYVWTPPGAHRQYALPLQFHRRYKLDAVELPQHHDGDEHLHWPRGRFRYLQRAEQFDVYQRNRYSVRPCPSRRVYENDARLRLAMLLVLLALTLPRAGTGPHPVPESDAAVASTHQDPRSPALASRLPRNRGNQPIDAGFSRGSRSGARPRS